MEREGIERKKKGARDSQTKSKTGNVQDRAYLVAVVESDSWYEYGFAQKLAVHDVRLRHETTKLRNEQTGAVAETVARI
jgi:hypothetical protein